jgi:hypothetical protein
MASGATRKISGISFLQIAALVSARSMRVWPGFCLAPAVTTTASALFSISMSSEPSNCASGTNINPWFRSRTSAVSFVFAASKRLICFPIPRTMQA